MSRPNCPTTNAIQQLVEDICRAGFAPPIELKVGPDLFKQLASESIPYNRDAPSTIPSPLYVCGIKIIKEEAETDRNQEGGLVKCGVCGKKYFEPLWIQEMGESKYCSKKCANEGSF